MADIKQEQVLGVLRRVVEPQSGQDIVSLGLVSGLVVRESNVGFAIEVTPDAAERMEAVRKAAEDAVFALDGIGSVTAVLTAERSAPEQAAPERLPPGEAPQPPQKAALDKNVPAGGLVPGIRTIIAVASGKGGVGKSTVSANLAVALAGLGSSVGLLDADIYGPSMPRMLGITGKPASPDGKQIIPMENHGLKVMSMGFLVPEDTPMIWRGPMVMGALEQMLRDVLWGELDVLVVDMPPGTGDVQLTMAQRVPLAGAIIVSTPQDIALLDARKGLNMFRKVDVPVLGIIENMSLFICPHCGERTDIFGHGGARAEAEKLGCPFLGEIPLHMQIRETGDSGIPIVVAAPESEHAKAYVDIARGIAATLDNGGKRAAPTISIR
ncbi:MAG: iron-sulfur cluster carrier protein ApbC [Alphaproteobacteria bacterium]